MGVEYMHGLFVVDTAWQPAWHHAERIDAVLQRWGFQRATAYYALADERADAIDEAAARAMPPNLLVEYGTLEGDRVPALLGPPAYDDAGDDRYIASARLCLGVDFKIIQVEDEEVEVIAPPRTGGTLVEPLFYDVLSPALHVYPATWTSTRAKTDAPGDFDRVWRCGLLLDCGKDVPAFAPESAPMPARDFVRELEGAFGARLAEVGWFY